MEKSFGRNVRFIGGVALRTILIACVVVLAFGVFGFLESTHYSVTDMVNEIRFMITYICVFIMLVLNVSVITAYMPMILSLGSKRREYFMARMFVTFVIMIAGIVVSSLMDASVGKYELSQMILKIAGMLALAGVGSLCANVINQFGMAGYIVFVICCGICGGIVGVITGMGENLSILNNTSIPYFALAGGIVLFVGTSIFEWKMLQSYEIK